MALPAWWFPYWFSSTVYVWLIFNLISFVFPDRLIKVLDSPDPPSLSTVTSPVSLLERQESRWSGFSHTGKATYGTHKGNTSEFSSMATPLAVMWTIWITKWRSGSRCSIMDHEEINLTQRGQDCSSSLGCHNQAKGLEQMTPLEFAHLINECIPLLSFHSWTYGEVDLSARAVAVEVLKARHWADLGMCALSNQSASTWVVFLSASWRKHSLATLVCFYFLCPVVP